MAIQSVTNAALATTLAAAPPRQGPQAPDAATDGAAADPARAAANPPPAAASRAEIEDAVAKVQKAVAPVASNLQFSIDQDTGRTVVKVVDATTNETIRQIPSEEVLSIARALDKLQGLLVKQTV